MTDLPRWLGEFDERPEYVTMPSEVYIELENQMECLSSSWHAKLSRRRSDGAVCVIPPIAVDSVGGSGFIKIKSSGMLQETNVWRQLWLRSTQIYLGQAELVPDCRPTEKERICSRI